MQNSDQTSAGNINLPQDDIEMIEKTQLSSSEEPQTKEEIKNEKKTNKVKSSKQKEKSKNQPKAEEKVDKVKKPRQSKKNKTGEDGAQQPSTDQQPLPEVKEQSAKAGSKRKEKEESKKEKKQSQMKIESAFTVKPKEETKNVIIEEVKMANQQNQDGDVQMIEQVIDNSAQSKDIGMKKAKMEKKTTPKKIEPVVVLPEKVLEWKAKKDHFATILRDLLNRGFDGREKHLNCGAEGLEGLQEQYQIPDDLKNSIQDKLIRIFQGQLNEEDLKQLKIDLNIDILKAVACLIESSHLTLKALSDVCLMILNKVFEQDSNNFEKFLSILNLHDLICLNAERKSYGIRDKLSVIYECESDDALWFWELSNTQILPEDKQKYYLNQRKLRQALQEKIKCLDKLIQLINKATSEKDLPKIVDEQEKYNKIIRKENASMQIQLEKEKQQREKEQKEKERLEQIQREKDLKEQERLLKEQQKEQERILKEQEKQQKEQERLKLIKEKEEQKERERLEKEKIAQEKAKQKEQERIEKLQRLELKRKQDEEAKNEMQNPNPTKIQKVIQPPIQQNTLLSMFSKVSTDSKPNVPIKKFQEDMQMTFSQGEQKSYIPQLVFPQPFQLQNPLLKQSPYYESETLKQQKRFREIYGCSFLPNHPHHEPYPNKYIFKPFFESYKKLDVVVIPKERRKCIIIEDSFMKYIGVFDKKSVLLDPRKPLMKDETLIDYDMSSEEEWNEQNGEDVDKNDQDGDAEDDEIEKMLQEESQSEGFIVPDDYISASELMFSQNEGSQVQHELEERRQAYAKRYNNNQNISTNLQHYIFMQDSKERGIQNYLKDYRAQAFPKTKLFPIKVKAQEEVENVGQDDKNGNSIIKFNPKAINQKLSELVKMMHGSFQSKQKIIEDFNMKNPECSRKSIEKKMRDLFEKDKKNEDPRQRWYATESTLIELNLNEDEELKELFNQRLAEVIEEIKKADEEALKLKEEKKALQLQQKQEKLEQKQQEKQQEAAAKAAAAAQTTHITPNKQPKLQFKDVEPSQKSKFLINIQAKVCDSGVDVLMENETELNTTLAVNLMPQNQSQNMDRQSCEKTNKPIASQNAQYQEDVKQQKNQGKQKNDKEIETVSKPPVKSLNSFFKAVDRDQQQKLNEAQLLKVKEEVTKQKQLKQEQLLLSSQVAVVDVNINKTLEQSETNKNQQSVQLSLNQFTTGVNLTGKQAQALNTSPDEHSGGVQIKMKKTKVKAKKEEKTDKEEKNSEQTIENILPKSEKSKPIKKEKTPKTDKVKKQKGEENKNEQAKSEKINKNKDDKIEKSKKAPSSKKSKVTKNSINKNDSISLDESPIKEDLMQDVQV